MKVRNIFVMVLSLSISLAVSGLEMRLKPGESPQSARDSIRAMRKSGRIAADEVATVTFAPGVYTVDRPLELGASDSFTVWRSEKRGTVRFLGGKLIAMSKLLPVRDAQTLARLDPAVRDAVRVVDVAQYLVKDLTQWPDKMDQLPGPWLYFNGEPQTIARWPNVDAPNGGLTAYTNLIDSGSAKLPGAFEFPCDRAARWNVGKGVWLMGYWAVDWHSETLRLGSYDKATRIARMACGSTYSLGKAEWWMTFKRRFHALNLLEELDAPGEWYLDREAKRLYWYPPTGAFGGGELALAQELTPFVHIKSARSVVLANLNFEYSHGGAAIVVDKCEDCSIRGCVIADHAGEAVTVSGRGNRIEDCDIRNLGATAVRIDGGDRVNLLPANNVLRNCTIENYAMFKRTMASGIVMTGCGNAVRGNTVRNAPYISLAYNGNEHLVANNEFDHVVLEAGDSGCIYSGHNASSLGTIVFGNHIHDLAKTSKEGNLRNGIYYDDCDWGDDVIGNTFERAGIAIFFGGGKLHGAYNNLVKDCLVGIHCDSRGREWRTNWRGSFGWDAKGRTFVRQRIIDDAGADPDFAPWRVVYPALEEAMYNRPELPGMNEVKGNVFSGVGRSVFRFDADTQKVLGKEPAGNTVLAKGETAPVKAPQPVQIADAVQNIFVSADGGTVLKVGLDDSARLSWAFEVGGRTVMPLSPMGVTVGYCDFGRKTVPFKAMPVQLSDVDLMEFGKVTCKVSAPRASIVRNMTTNFMVDAEMRGWTVPVHCLVSGMRTASLEVRVWNGGAAARWRIPGAGERMVYGENAVFRRGLCKYGICEWARGENYPESLNVPRGKDATGIVFPEYPRGWKHTGELVTPWRGVVAEQD